MQVNQLLPEEMIEQIAVKIDLAWEAHFEKQPTNALVRFILKELLTYYEQTQTPRTPSESESSTRSEDATYFDNAIDSWPK